MRFKNIEFLRFMFAVITVYFHIYHSNIVRFVGENQLYKTLLDGCGQAGLAVEMFLIIAGFFFFQSINKRKEQSCLDFALNKIARLWPVLAFSVLCAGILSIFGILKFNFNTQLINLLMLNNIGINLDYRGITWFIAPFFWVMVLFFYFLKNWKIEKADFIIALLVYFSLVVKINYGHGHIGGRNTLFYFLSGGVMRCIIGLGLGYFIGKFYNRVKNCPVIFKTKVSKITKYVLVSATEIYCFSFLIYRFLIRQASYPNDIIFLIVFSIMFFLFLIKQGFLSRLLENNISDFLGKYSYSIYVMQQTAFLLLGVFVWKHQAFILNHIWLNLFISIGFSVLLGALVYHFVEVPVGKFLREKFALIFSQKD